MGESGGSEQSSNTGTVQHWVTAQPGDPQLPEAGTGPHYTTTTNTLPPSNHARHSQASKQVCFYEGILSGNQVAGPISQDLLDQVFI